MPNIFLQRKVKLRLSYRTIATRIGVQHGYIYRLMKDPGACDNLRMISRVGFQLGMAPDEITNEWIHLRIAYLIKRAGV